MAVRLLTENDKTDPVEELKEGVEVLARLSTNPLLSDLARDAVESNRRMLRMFLPFPRPSA